MVEGELVDALEFAVFVRLDILEAAVTGAVRDRAGVYTWVELDPAFRGATVQLCRRASRTWLTTSRRLLVPRGG